MGKLIQLNDFRKFDSSAYLTKIKQMNILDLMVEMSDFTEEWQKHEKNSLPSEVRKKGIILFTEIYHICQTPELRQAALTALSELQKHE